MRERQGLSANAAARQANISSQRWRQIELGRELRGGYEIPAKPTRRTVIAMAKVLGWPLDQALLSAGFSPTEPESAEEESLDLPAEDWQRLTSAQRKALRLLISTMITP
jgi:transcriptional regulator with XRE-family HTH domain